MTNANLDMLGLHKATWGQQFSEAMNVNGGEIDSATVADYIMHFFTFGWKVGFIIFYISFWSESVLQWVVSAGTASRDDLAFV